MSATVGITVPLPVLGVLDQAAAIMPPGNIDVISISGCLQSMTSGTLAMRLRDQSGNTIASLSFNGTGKQSGRSILSSPFAIPDGGELRWDITGLGVLPVGLYATVWFLTY